MHPRVRTTVGRSAAKKLIAASRLGSSRLGSGIGSWHAPIEALEPRQLLDGSPSTTLYPISALYSAPLSSTGWAQLPTQTNGWIVYVSSSEGDDSNSGHDPDHPVATLAKAKSMMRDGHDDQMLLLRGDVWDEPIGTWTTSGVSPTDPQVISYYSSDPSQPTALDRPLIDSGTNDGITVTGHASYLAIIGLQFSPNSINGESYDGTNSTGVAGMRFQLTGHDYLVEDCLVDGYKDNIVVGNPGAPVTDFVIHRSESLDSYNLAGAHSQGLYVSGVCDDVLIQENTFDHNGWKNPDDKTFFNHNMYINTGAGHVEVLDNVITRGSLRGTLLRAGGIVEGNFYDQNAVAIQVDNTASTVENNVILEGDDLPSLPSGVGIDVSFDIPSVDIENNIIAHDISDYTPNVSGIDLEEGTRQATVLNNIVYDWRRPLINGVVSSGNDLATIAGNDLEEFDSHHPVINLRGSGGTYTSNTYYDPNESKSFEIGDNESQDEISYNTWKGDESDSSGFVGDGTAAPNYVDPNLSMATYAASIGLSRDQQSFDGWVAQQRSQSNGSWNTQFTAAAEDAYIKAGFTSDTDISVDFPRVSVTASASDGVPNTTSTITETSGTGIFDLQRTGSTDSTLSVNYSITGTATNGVDYTELSSSSAFFAVGVTDVFIDVNPIHDKNADGTPNVEQPETVKLNITASSANPPTYVPGVTSSATVTINDSDGGNQPVTPPSTGGPAPTPPTDDSGGSGGGGSGTSSSPTTGTGLTANYYNNQDLIGSPVYTTTVTSVDFSNASGLVVANHPEINPIHSSVAYTGKIQPPSSGNYTFTISVDADAAVRLYVDDGSDQPQIYLGTTRHRTGDANDDATVNSQDFAALAAHYGQTSAYWDQGDFNGDGTVNALDFNALANSYGTQDTRTAQTISGTAFLEGDTAYNIRLEYSQKVGDASLQFQWSGPGLSGTANPPTNRLYTGSGAPEQSIFAPEMSDSVEASTLPAAVPSSSIFSSTAIASSDKDVIG